MDQQLGAMAVLRMLMDLDSDVVFAGAASPLRRRFRSPPLPPADPASRANVPARRRYGNRT
jgi:hypothetical protein